MGSEIQTQSVYLHKNQLVCYIIRFLMHHFYEEKKQIDDMVCICLKQVFCVIFFSRAEMFSTIA